MAYPRARTTDLLLQSTGDDLIVFDQQRQLAHTLNRTAALIFKHADGTRAVADLVAVLQAELNEVADEDLVRMALDRLRRADLLEHAETRSMDALRASRRRFVRKVGMVGALTLLLPMVETIVAPRTALAQSGDPTCASDSDSGCESQCLTGCNSDSQSLSASQCDQFCFCNSNSNSASNFCGSDSVFCASA